MAHEGLPARINPALLQDFGNQPLLTFGALVEIKPLQQTVQTGTSGRAPGKGER